MKLLCPHCGQPVKANPIGRWYARFLCPHCKGKLQFDSRTNATGIAGSAAFFVMAYAIAMGRGETAWYVAAAAGVVWIATLAASYFLRGIVKG